MGPPDESSDQGDEKRRAPASRLAAPDRRGGIPQFYDQDQIEATRATSTPTAEPSGGRADEEGRPRKVVDIYALVRASQGLAGPSTGRRTRAGAPLNPEARPASNPDGWAGGPGPAAAGDASPSNGQADAPTPPNGQGQADAPTPPNGEGEADAPTQIDVFRHAPVIASPPPAPPRPATATLGPASPPPPPPVPGRGPAPSSTAQSPPAPAPTGEAHRAGGEAHRAGGEAHRVHRGGGEAHEAGDVGRQVDWAPSAPSTPSPSNFGRDTGVVAAGTFLSRITGFARTLTILGVLGSTGLGDAYNLANTVPNIVYELILGGVLSATMIPVFVEQFRREDRAAGERSISAVLTGITAVLVVVTLLLYLFAPAVIHFYLLFNHQATGGDERAVGTSLLRLFAPQVLFLGAIVVTTALLNARRHFAAPAFSPVINNLIMIIAILVTDLVARTLEIGPFRHDHSAILVLGIGTTLGYFVQFLIHIPALARAGIRIRPVWDLRDPALRQITRLSSWLVGVVLANQVSLTVVIILAAQVPGSFTVYSAAFTFFQLPYALFAVSLASVLTPDLAERWTVRDRRGFRNRMIAGLRITLAVMIPAGIGYAIVARPVILLAAHHGATSTSSAHLLASSLTLFAIGLPGYSAFLLLLRGLQAMQDAKAMFSVYLLENALSVVLAFALYPSLGVRGLVLAWVMPYTLCTFVAVGQLRRRMGPFGGYPTVRALLRIGVSTGIMAVAVFGIARILPHGDSDPVLALRLIAQVVVGAVVYVYSARVFGLGELDPVLALARRLMGRRPPGPPRPGLRPQGGPSPKAPFPDGGVQPGRSRSPVGRHFRVD